MTFLYTVAFHRLALNRRGNILGGIIGIHHRGYEPTLSPSLRAEFRPWSQGPRPGRPTIGPMGHDLWVHITETLKGCLTSSSTLCHDSGIRKLFSALWDMKTIRNFFTVSFAFFFKWAKDVVVFLKKEKNNRTQFYHFKSKQMFFSDQKNFRILHTLCIL